MAKTSYVEVGSGALGINWAKTEPNHPDYRGKFTLDGVDYTFSAWKKIRKDDGREFISFNISKVIHNNASPSTTARASGTPSHIGGPNDMDDDIPF